MGRSNGTSLGRNLSFATHLPRQLGRHTPPRPALEALLSAPLDPRRAMDRTHPPSNKTPFPLRLSPPAAFVSLGAAPALPWPQQGERWRGGGREGWKRQQNEKLGRRIGKKEMKMGEARIRIQALPPTPSAKSRAAVPSLLKQTGNPCSGLFPCPGQARPHSPTPPAALRENRHVPRGPKGGCFLSPTQLSGAL